MEQTIKLPPNPATCLLEIVTTVNNVTATESNVPKPETVTSAKPLVPSSAVAVSKRLGRGTVTSGLTCECGVFGAMACGEWPTQRVSNMQLRNIRIVDHNVNLITFCSF